MQIPIEIAFHHLDSNPQAEEEIRTRVAKLEKIYDRLTTCRVRVDQRNNNANGTIPPVVHIEISIPGHKDLVVSHEPGHLQRKFQTPDLFNAIHEAFRIAEDRLVEFKNQRQRRTKEAHHDGENQFLGQVADRPAGEDFAFLLTKEGNLLYFHRNSVLSGDFDAFQRGDEVYYVEDAGDTGPTAAKVRLKSAQGSTH
jgi:ribosome-associated translation inhibitor RaiA/cold shock CspA family protein